MAQPEAFMHEQAPAPPTGDDGQVQSMRNDLRAALRSLEDARREFRVWSQRRDGTRPGRARDPEGLPPSTPPPARRFVREPESPPGGPEAAEPEAPIRDAEAEAEAYLAAAKRRVDALCRSMLSTIEEEAWALRREAEEAIRARWTEAEAEAETYLEGSRRQADRIVVERQARITELSQSITLGAARITSRLDDADRVQRQFDRLVRALSATAGRIAEELGAGAGGGRAAGRR